MVLANENKLTQFQRDLLKAASKALQHSYSPYSQFAVGAVLATHTQKMYEGANVENSSYGCTICAERAAICHANIKGERCFEYLAIVALDRGFSRKRVVAPCGICRQMLWEFSSLYNQEMTVIMATYDLKLIEIVSLNDLMPKAFGPHDMGLSG